MFRYCETEKFLDGKSWHNSLKHKFFRCPKSVTPWRVPLRIFSALCDKKLSTENHDAPTLIHKLPEISWNTAQKGSSTKCFGTARQNKVDKKSWHNPLKHRIFRYPKSVTPWRVPLRIFSALCDKKYSKENLDTSPSLSSINFFATRNLLKHSTEGFFYEMFRYCETKKFDRKSWYPPPLLSLTFFDIRNFVKHRRVTLRKFLALWDKNFSTKNRDTLLHKVQKAVVELMFVKTLWKPISKQLFCFWPFAKNDQNICSCAKNMPVLAGRLV